MATRRPNYKQLALPFDKATLRQPVTPTVLTQQSASALPPGLRELADAEKLGEREVRQLAEAYTTIRGRKPTTAAEWRPLYEAVKRFSWEVNEADANAP